jgi:hypothetical protein
LLSKVEMRKKGWWPDATGGNQLSWDLDEYRGIDDDISLCLTRNHPMKYLANKEGRLPNPKYLAISPQVLLTPNTRIAFGVANSNDVDIVPIEDGLEQLDVEVIYSRTKWSDPAIYQRLCNAEKFEVLIPKRIPKELILGVA